MILVVYLPLHRKQKCEKHPLSILIYFTYLLWTLRFWKWALLYKEHQLHQNISQICFLSLFPTVTLQLKKTTVKWCNSESLWGKTRIKRKLLINIFVFIWQPENIAVMLNIKLRTHRRPFFSREGKTHQQTLKIYFTSIPLSRTENTLWRKINLMGRQTYKTA